MKHYKSFYLSLMVLTVTTFAFTQDNPSSTTLSSIEQQASQLENQIQLLEEKIAAFEDREISKESIIENRAVDVLQTEGTSSLPLNAEEKSFLLAQEYPAPEASQAVVMEERSAFRVDLKQAFSGAPIIYSILAFLSMFSFSLWFYSMLKIKKSLMTKKELLDEVKNKLIINQYDEAVSLLEKNPNVLSKMLLSLIGMRKLGHSAMLEAMKAEGKRATLSFWQKLGLLNDVAIVAPMLGLLGTVLGMFYAFYDINRSIESITTLFDGLGISVGTTVAGLIVALFAMLFHSVAKFRLVKELAAVENEAHSFVPLIDLKQQ